MCMQYIKRYSFDVNAVTAPISWYNPRMQGLSYLAFSNDSLRRIEETSSTLDETVKIF